MLRAHLLSVLFLLSVAAGSALAQRGEDIRFQSGNIKVKRDEVRLREAGKHLANHMILRDQINFGYCFEDPKYRRVPVTYYHPQGPLGLALRKFNWFAGPVNTYHADARLPAALAALGCFPYPAAGCLTQLAALWSEPPVAVIGMEAGTPASYARPLQHFHFYEPTKEVIDLNHRQDKDRFFHFISDARERGAQVDVVHGPPRQELRQRGPRRFYHLMILEACSGENGEKIFLDLFTREGIAQCFEHLVDDGILCVHTSHRFVDLPPVLAAIGKDLKLHVRRGHDMAPNVDWARGGNDELAEIGHFTSEWVLLTRNQTVLDAVCTTPPKYEEALKTKGLGRFAEYWTTPTPREPVWTDKGPNLLHGILRGHPFAMRYAAVARPVCEFADDAAQKLGVNPTARRMILELGSMPRPLEDWMVQQQLRNNPQVEKLWR